MTEFFGYKVYGPYYHKKIDRNMIFLVKPDHRTSMTYARYLMCIKEQRWLEYWEHVDHIDDNRLNDVIENLQILKQLDNSRKSAKGVTYISFKCGWKECGKNFLLEKRQTYKKRKFPPCCSRSCAGKLNTRGYTSDG